MSDLVDLLREVDGRMTRVTLKYPDAWGYIWRQHKHVRQAVNRPDMVDNREKVLRKSRDWMVAALVNHPMFDDDFRPVVNDITDYFKDRKKI